MKKYIQITHEGSKVIETVESAKDFIQSMEDDGPYVFRAVYMTEKDFNELP